MSTVNHVALGMVNIECVKLTPSFGGRAFRLVGGKPKAQTRHLITFAGDNFETPLDQPKLPSPLPIGKHFLHVGYVGEADDLTITLDVNAAPTNAK